jgi:hypothetical protein
MKAARRERFYTILNIGLLLGASFSLVIFLPLSELLKDRYRGPYTAHKLSLEDAWKEFHGGANDDKPATKEPSARQKPSQGTDDTKTTPRTEETSAKKEEPTANDQPKTEYQLRAEEAVNEFWNSKFSSDYFGPDLCGVRPGPEGDEYVRVIPVGPTKIESQLLSEDASRRRVRWQVITTLQLGGNYFLYRNGTSLTEHAPSPTDHPFKALIEENPDGIFVSYPDTQSYEMLKTLRANSCRDTPAGMSNIEPMPDSILLDPVDSSGRPVPRQKQER